MTATRRVLVACVLSLVGCETQTAPDASTAVDGAVRPADAGNPDALRDAGSDALDAPSCPPPVSHEAGLAFPGAEGFGRFARGGRGGRVIEVTNLDAEGPGSLRACLEATGPRTCVFRTSGTIVTRSIRMVDPFITIAGQTAPGEGILVRGGEIEAMTHDVIVRYLRVSSGVLTPGAISSTGGIEAYSAQNMIVDHCSMTWAPDDTAAAWGPGTENVTYQWSLIAEGLYDPSIEQSGKAFLIGNGATRTSLLHSLLAHMGDRAPQVGSGDAQIVNNVIYDIAGAANVLPREGPIQVEFIGNFFQRGPDAERWGINATTIRTLGPGWPGLDYPVTHADATRIYLRGNLHNTRRPDGTYPEDAVVYQPTDLGARPLPIVTTPLGFPTIASETDARTALRDVLAEVGATLPMRNAIDARIAQSVADVTGNPLLTSPDEAGGYPTIPVVSRAPDYDVDVDGMADDWERERGFDPTDAIDGTLDRDGDGYTNLEEFLNETDPSCPS